MALTLTKAVTTTKTITRLALVSYQFSRFLQRLPGNVMNDERRKLFLDHIRRRNIDRISLVGQDGDGAALVLAHCTVNWSEFKEQALLQPQIEVAPGKEGLEVTVATLDAFDQIVEGYRLEVSGWVRLTPCDANKEALIDELQLGKPESIRWKGKPQVVAEDSDAVLPELSMGMILAELQH